MGTGVRRQPNHPHYVVFGFASPSAIHFAGAAVLLVFSCQQCRSLLYLKTDY
jgi:hypothetical protein